MAVVLLAAVILGVLLAARVVTGGGTSAPVVAGDAFVTAGRPGDLAIVNEGSTGYDGQFVYRLALDPFTREKAAYGITLDNPPYRQQRIGLPLAANVVSRTGIPLSVSLLLVNTAALLAATWAGAVLARRLGRHALWGVLVGLSPGLVVAVTRDLTEPLATALLLVGLVGWTTRRTPHVLLATAAFTASVLTRETSLAVLFGLGLYEAYSAATGPDRGEAVRRAALLLVPVVAVVAWQLHLENVWGELPIRATDGDVGAPFLQTASRFLADGGDWSDWASKDALLAHAWVAERVLLAAILATTALALRRTTTDAATRAAWVVASLLSLSTAWGRDVAFLRGANEAVVLSTLVLLGARSRAATAALAGTAGLSLFVAAVYGVAI